MSWGKYFEDIRDEIEDRGGCLSSDGAAVDFGGKYAGYDSEAEEIHQLVLKPISNVSYSEIKRRNDRICQLFVSLKTRICIAEKLKENLKFSSDLFKAMLSAMNETFKKEADKLEKVILNENLNFKDFYANEEMETQRVISNYLNVLVKSAKSQTILSLEEINIFKEMVNQLVLVCHSKNDEMFLGDFFGQHTKRCPHCGKQSVDQLDFCLRCGGDIR